MQNTILHRQPAFVPQNQVVIESSWTLLMGQAESQVINVIQETHATP